MANVFELPACVRSKSDRRQRHANHDSAPQSTGHATRTETRAPLPRLNNLLPSTPYIGLIPRSFYQTTDHPIMTSLVAERPANRMRRRARERFHARRARYISTSPRKSLSSLLKRDILHCSPSDACQSRARQLLSSARQNLPLKYDYKSLIRGQLHVRVT